MMLAPRLGRMKREMTLFDDHPPHGISCWVKEETVGRLEAQIIGDEETPYSGGIFTLDIFLPDRYPFEPPKINFVTPIYHPNVDTGGRICLESLKMPPGGAWSPVLNVATVLTTIQHLMAEPNPDDPLMAEIADEFKSNRALFEQNARLWTQRHAMADKVSNTGLFGHLQASQEGGNAENVLKLDNPDVLKINDNTVKRLTEDTYDSARPGTSKRICGPKLFKQDSASLRPAQLK